MSAIYLPKGYQMSTVQMNLVNLNALPNVQQEPLWTIEKPFVYMADGFGQLMRDWGLFNKKVYPVGSEPFQYTDKYGSTYYYLYGPASDSRDILTEK